MHERFIRFFSTVSCIIITLLFLMCFVKVLMMNATLSDVFHTGAFLGLLWVGFCLGQIGWAMSRQCQAAPASLRLRALRVNGTAFAFIMMAMCLVMR